MQRRIIQVVGLPGSGKTSAIDNFIKENPNKNIISLDIRYDSAESIKRKIQKDLNANFIIESASGFLNIPSLVIKVETPIPVVKQRLLQRDGFYSQVYLEHLGSTEIASDYRIEEGQLAPLLFYLLNNG